MSNEFGVSEYYQLQHGMKRYYKRIRSLCDEIGFTSETPSIQGNPWVFSSYEIDEDNKGNAIVKVTAYDACYDQNEYRHYSFPFSYLNDPEGEHFGEYTRYEEEQEKKRQEAQNQERKRLAEAMAKITPKKVMRNEDTGDFFCPVCERKLRTGVRTSMYCDGCGQAIDWSGVQ